MFSLEKQHKVQQELTEQGATIVQFLRELIAIPSTNGQLDLISEGIESRLAELKFDEVKRDRLGNILGRVGSGPRILLYDSHIDTVDIAEPGTWKCNPFEGMYEGNVLYGLGASSGKSSSAAIVYAMATLRNLGLLEDWTLYYFGNRKYCCEGLSARELVEQGVRPDFVVVGDGTGMEIFHGYCGHMEVKVTFRGQPLLNDNFSHSTGEALSSAIEFASGIEQLSQSLRTQEGGQSKDVVLTVTDLQASNAIGEDVCTLYLDCYLPTAELQDRLLPALRGLPNGQHAQIVVADYALHKTGPNKPALEKNYCTAELEEEHPYVYASKFAFENCFSSRAKTGKWFFPTNASYWLGVAGIPTIGFGPGQEVWTCTPKDQVSLAHVTQSTHFYALLPHFLSSIVPI